MESPVKKKLPPAQPPYIPPYYYEEDEVTLKDIILIVKDYWKEIFKWSNLLWIGLAMLVGTGLFWYKTSFEKTTYTSALTFSSGNNFDVQSVQLNPMLGEARTAIQPNKIAELARSSIIIHNVLFKKIAINGKEDFIANHLIDLYNFHAKWEREPLLEKNKEVHLNNFYFTNSLSNTPSLKERRAVNQIQNILAGSSLSGINGLMNTSYDKRSDLFKINVITNNAALSNGLMEQTYQELKDFYIQINVGQPKRTLQFLETRIDSVLTVLDKTRSQLAFESNRNRSLREGFVNLGYEKLTRKVAEIEQTYNRLVQHKENAVYLVESNTPDFQIIDQTFTPIVKAPSRRKNLLIGGFLGLFLGVGFVILKKIIRDALAE